MMKLRRNVEALIFKTDAESKSDNLGCEFRSEKLCPLPVNSRMLVALNTHLHHASLSKFPDFVMSDTIRCYLSVVTDCIIPFSSNLPLVSHKILTSLQFVHTCCVLTDST